MFENDEVAALFEGVEYFFDAIKAKCSNDKEYAAEILKARGFLLEDEGLILSNNSHRDDATYLEELLKETNLENIFYKNNRIGYETRTYPQSWRRFMSNKHAPKVSLRILEPFVARYVKAISACGVATSKSCDGNHYPPERFQTVIVDFSGKANALWHEIICKRLLAGNFDLKWELNGCRAEIKFNKMNKWQTYTELNRAAEFLYNNRIKIRQIRREASDGISVSMARHLSDNELAKIFSERANKLFDELSL